MFAFFNLGPSEAFILLGLGVLLFGRRLPEVGRWVGQGFRSFKDGVSGIEDEIHETLNRSEPAPAKLPARIAQTLPRFEEKTSAPDAPPAI